jgi:hypothetical protein
MGMTRRRPNRFVNYGGRLYAVIDQPDTAARARGALVQSGIGADRIEVLHGETGATDGIAGEADLVTHRPGLFARLRRAIEFTLMDQAPDIAWYEAALRSGRSVVGVRVSREVDVHRAVDVLRLFGAHFINHFGWFSTEEFERWQGPEPTVPDYLRR